MPEAPRARRFLRAAVVVAVAAGLGYGLWRHLRADLVERNAVVFGGAKINARFKLAVGPGRAEAADQALDRALSAVREVGERMSAHRSQSEIGRLNRLAPGEALALSPSTYTVLLEAMRYHRLSGGAFDVTVGPLLELYTFEGQLVDGLPPQERVNEVRARMGSRLVDLDPQERTVRVRRAGVRVDLGAIAKGYAVDRAVLALRAAGFASGFVEIGGEVRVFGPHPSRRAWAVGVQDPRRGGEAVLERIELVDCAVATSGNYRRYFVHQGTRYSHIVDPRTGRPVSGTLVGVTVIVPEAARTDPYVCTAADAMATTVSVLGVDAGREFLSQLPGVEAILQVQAPDGEVRLVRYPDEDAPAQAP